jgi:hypothetical protein
MENISERILSATPTTTTGDDGRHPKVEQLLYTLWLLLAAGSSPYSSTATRGVWIYFCVSFGPEDKNRIAVDLQNRVSMFYVPNAR